MTDQMRSWRRAAALAALCTAVALCQSDLGTISGFVRDPSTAVVPNATVHAKN